MACCGPILESAKARAGSEEAEGGLRGGGGERGTPLASLSFFFCKESIFFHRLPRPWQFSMTGVPQRLSLPPSGVGRDPDPVPGGWWGKPTPPPALAIPAGNPCPDADHSPPTPTSREPMSGALTTHPPPQSLGSMSDHLPFTQCPASAPDTAHPDAPRQTPACYWHPSPSLCPGRPPNRATPAPSPRPRARPTGVTRFGSPDTTREMPAAAGTPPLTSLFLGERRRACFPARQQLQPRVLARAPLLPRAPRSGIGRRVPPRSPRECRPRKAPGRALHRHPRQRYPPAPDPPPPPERAARPRSRRLSSDRGPGPGAAAVRRAAAGIAA